MLTSFVARIRSAAASVVRKVRRVLKEATRPLPLLTGLVADLTRSGKELLAENALLRQRLIVVRRQTKRPRLLRHERAVMVAVLVLNTRHLQHVLEEYCFHYFNRSRPHQGLGQRVPVSGPQRVSSDVSRIVATPVLGGLHHEYRAAA